MENSQVGRAPAGSSSAPPLTSCGWPDLAAMTVPADLDRLAEIRALVREVAIEGGAPPVCLDALVQAVDEAATNIVVHGYGHKGGPIDIDARIEDELIV